jgi:4-carboxymuconolactone decarboxylase
MIADDKQNEAQRRAVKSIVSGKRGNVGGPFPALLRSPDLCERAAHLGEFLRFGTSLSPRLSEMAILMTAVRWRAQYEWYAHASLARKGGLADDVIEALRTGRTPTKMQDDEAALYAFCTELHDTKRVSDAVYKNAVAAFGETGVVEIIGLSGYYTLVSMALNVSGVELPAGEPLPFPE